MSDITWKTMLKMREKTKEVCEEYSLPLIEVTYNNRLKTTAGRYCWNTYKGTQYIEIATNLVEKFGVDRGMTTLLHELAHYINQVKYNGSGCVPNIILFCIVTVKILLRSISSLLRANPGVINDHVSFKLAFITVIFPILLLAL